MNRANRSLFSKLKQQYELKKMMAAYIGAEQQIIANSSNGMADGMEFYVEHDPFGNPAVIETTVKEQQIQRLEAQMLEMEEAGTKTIRTREL